MEELQRNDPENAATDAGNTLDVIHEVKPPEAGTAANLALKLAIPDAGKPEKLAGGSNNQSRADTRMNSGSNRPSMETMMTKSQALIGLNIFSDKTSRPIRLHSAAEPG